MILEYADHWSAADDSTMSDPRVVRQATLFNWYVRNAQLYYKLGIISDAETRMQMEYLFRDEHQRLWWDSGRNFYLSSGWRRDRRFVALIEDEYRKALLRHADREASQNHD